MVCQLPKGSPLSKYLQGLKEMAPISREVEHYSMQTKPAAIADGTGILIVARTDKGAVQFADLQIKVSGKSCRGMTKLEC
jgi:hypothetical protein